VDHPGAEDADAVSDAATTADFAVGDRVRIFPGSSDEGAGTIIDDFGDDAGYGVDIGTRHIADPGRRWAITLDDGGLVFIDSSSLTTEPGRGQHPKHL
jgi:hypothetical protein